jgi:hypothetical protein
MFAALYEVPWWVAVIILGLAALVVAGAIVAYRRSS